MSIATVSFDVEYTAEVPDGAVDEFLSEEEFKSEMVKELGLDLEDVVDYEINVDIDYPEQYDG